MTTFKKIARESLTFQILVACIAIFILGRVYMSVTHSAHPFPFMLPASSDLTWFVSGTLTWWLSHDDLGHLLENIIPTLLLLPLVQGIYGRRTLLYYLILVNLVNFSMHFLFFAYAGLLGLSHFMVGLFPLLCIGLLIYIKKCSIFFFLYLVFLVLILISVISAGYTAFVQFMSIISLESPSELVSDVAHSSGFLVGFLFGLVWYIRGRKEKRKFRVIAAHAGVGKTELSELYQDTFVDLIAMHHRYSNYPKELEKEEEYLKADPSLARKKGWQKKYVRKIIRSLIFSNKILLIVPDDEVLALLRRYRVPVLRCGENLGDFVPSAIVRKRAEKQYVDISVLQSHRGVDINADSPDLLEYQREFPGTCETR